MPKNIKGCLSKDRQFLLCNGKIKGKNFQILQI